MAEPERASLGYFVAIGDYGSRGQIAEPPRIMPQ